MQILQNQLFTSKRKTKNQKGEFHNALLIHISCLLPLQMMGLVRLIHCGKFFDFREITFVISNNFTKL